MHKRMKSLMCILTLAAGFGVFQWINSSFERNVRKLLLPGNYQIALRRGHYEVWYFWKWPSKCIEQQPQKLFLSITTKDGETIPPSVQTHPDTNKFVGSHFGNNEGWKHFEIDLKRDEICNFRSPNTAVVAIVPQESAFIWLDENNFFGSSDDQHFLSR